MRNWAATLRVDFRFRRIRRSGPKNTRTLSRNPSDPDTLYVYIAEVRRCTRRGVRYCHVSQNSGNFVSRIRQMRRRFTGCATDADASASDRPFGNRLRGSADIVAKIFAGRLPKLIHLNFNTSRLWPQNNFRRLVRQFDLVFVYSEHDGQCASLVEPVSSEVATPSRRASDTCAFRWH